MSGRKRSAPPLELLILDELARRSPQTLAELRHAIQGSDRLLTEDKAPHGTRHGEPNWHSDLSNQLQPSRPKSLSGRGYTKNTGHGQFAITPNGEAYRQSEHVENKKFAEMLSSINIDSAK